MNKEVYLVGKIFIETITTLKVEKETEKTITTCFGKFRKSLMENNFYYCFYTMEEAKEKRIELIKNAIKMKKSRIEMLENEIAEYEAFLNEIEKDLKEKKEVTVELGCLKNEIL